VSVDDSPTIEKVLRQGAPALGPPNGEPLSYAGLRTAVDALAQTRAASGLSHGDRVAVVLRQGAQVDAERLRAYLAERLAPFKVPRKLLDAIPLGPTGKLQRSRLAELLADALGLAP